MPPPLKQTSGELATGRRTEAGGKGLRTVCLCFSDLVGPKVSRVSRAQMLASWFCGMNEVLKLCWRKAQPKSFHWPEEAVTGFQGLAAGVSVRL